MLSPTQLKLREGKLTASRIACLMTGDAEKINQLYLEMIGEAEPIDLSHVWPVRLGEATEALNLDWFEEKNKTPVTRRGEVVAHAVFDWAACTLDGWITGDLDCPIEAKHVGGREPLEVTIARWQPQLQWIMQVTDSSQCALSVISGASEPIVEYIEADEAYQREQILRGTQFMECVRARRAPVTLAAVASPIKAEKVYDMTDHAVWAQQAGLWIQSWQAAISARDAEKTLKSLVPADAAKAHGAGIRITRNRAGSLSLREDK